jgi:hypothetical protein
MGKYKRYLIDDSIRIPKSTIQSRRNKLKKKTNNQEIILTNIIASDSIDKVIINDNPPIINIDELSNHSNVDEQFEIIDENKIEIDELVNLDLICASVLTLFFSSNLTQSSLELIIKHTQLFNQIELPKSFNSMVNTLVNKEDLKYEKKWYCQSCESYFELDYNKSRRCSKCNEWYNVFYYIPIKPQLDMLFKKNKLPVLKSQINSDPDFIQDIYDSKIYKDFKSKFVANNEKYENIYSFCINTDGISLSEKSNLSIWPVFLCINELSINERFYIDNTVIAGKFN